MKINEKIEEAIFINRPNRFIANVNLNGEEKVVHVPNTGRCKEIFIKGTRVILRKFELGKRKTEYDLISAYKGVKLINIDSQMPNKIVFEALENKKIQKLNKYENIEKEKTFLSSRFDFRLYNNNEDIYYLEVKGVTLEEMSIAKFPDAPTLRGEKHVRELIKAKQDGFGAGIVFLIQIEDVKSFTPNKDMDEKFSRAILDAKSNNVDLFAYNCIVKEDEIMLKDEIQIYM